MQDVPVKSVRKALEILDILLFDDPPGNGIGLSELARKLSMPANTAHNLLKTLISCSYAAQSADGRYTFGPRCREFGYINQYVRQGSEQYAAAIEEASERLGEVVVLTMLAGARRIIVHRVDSRQAIRVDRAAVEAAPIYRLTTGRILTAFASAAARDTIVARYGLPGADWDGITTREALDKACERLRKAGISVMPHLPSELLAMAVPVISEEGQTFALGAYAPAFRWPEERHREFANVLRETATALSSVM